MNKTTAKALEQSIKHWERMRDTHPVNAIEFPTSSHCALCKEFFDKAACNAECRGCPIYIRTRHKGCARGPFNVACDAFYDALWNDDKQSLDKWKKKAQKMIDFLISLRDQP